MANHHRNGEHIDLCLLAIEIPAQLIEPHALLSGLQHPYEQMITVESERRNLGIRRRGNALKAFTVVRAAIERGGAQLKCVNRYLDQALGHRRFFGRIRQRARSSA